jgi:hypothetical protein
MRRTSSILLVWLLLVCCRGAYAEPSGAPAPIDYTRQVRQILSNHCYACHGPDEAQRQAGLRLDQKDSAFSTLESGERAIVAGSSDRSALVARITTTDASQLMPPPDAGKPLSAEQIDILRKWIDQGATWDEHWAYRPIARPVVPPVYGAAWPRTEIDHFILARLEREGLQPEPEADKSTLIRRLSFDLTGLPPTPAEVESFVSDARADAYERLVDRLLASPRYGERMAQKWLDLARYADTNGYHIDNHRTMWLYRDWVIDAFNRNLPFDQFTIEQMAGDLLPGASQEQQIASGFHRNVMVNFEGGADPAEYLSKYIVDRVTTTATVFLGTTLACTECHDHKYDPFTQREFYQLYAYFHNVPEEGLDGQKQNPKPSMRIASEEQNAELATLVAQAQAVEGEIAAALAKHREAVHAAPVEPAAVPSEFVWVDDALPEGAAPEGDVKKGDTWPFVASPQPVLNGRSAIRLEAKEMAQHVFTGARRPLVIGEGDKLVAHVWIDPANPPQEIMLQFNDGGSWEHRALWGGDKIAWGKENSPSRLAMGALPPAGRWVRLEVNAQAVGLAAGTIVDGWACTQFAGHAFWDKLGIVSRLPQGPALDANQTAWELAERARKKVPAPVTEALKVEPAKRSPDQAAAVRDYYVRYAYAPTRAVFDPLERRLARLNQEQVRLRDAFTETMVMRELEKPRETFVLVRGDFRTFGEKVQPGVPASLPPLAAGAPPNRLGLAQWLVDERNPLVARVTVNRYWQQYFGTGLVKTSEDFGSQGERPSHPELLDWLASSFVAGGWDIKALQKRIVMSAVYRQSANVDPKKLNRDPENRLLARAPRFRLDAEMIRDAALSAGGLLDRRIGGPSVAPYQPPGLWEQVGFEGFSSQKYEQSHGPDLYRRGIYVYLKRAMPYPPLVTFDAPNREVCTDRRERTNTPLQALVLLNDPGFVEAARGLAQRIMTEGGTTPEERVALGFKLCTARAPTRKEVRVLLSIYEQQRTRFQGDPEAARKLTSVGESPVPAGLDVVELAAWTAVGNVLLNLDETISKG